MSLTPLQDARDRCQRLRNGVLAVREALPATGLMRRIGLLLDRIDFELDLLTIDIDYAIEAQRKGGNP